MTYDQGKEMSQHEKLLERIGVKVYIACPVYLMGGINENTSGFLRQYSPKEIDLPMLNQEDLDSVAWALDGVEYLSDGGFLLPLKG
jgi:IS30 family transposase